MKFTNGKRVNPNEIPSRPMNKNPELNKAFCNARQSKTKLARIEKCRPGVMDGKGLQDC